MYNIFILGVQQNYLKYRTPSQSSDINTNDRTPSQSSDMNTNDRTPSSDTSKVHTEWKR